MSSALLVDLTGCNRLMFLCGEFSIDVREIPSDGNNRASCEVLIARYQRQAGGDVRITSFRTFVAGCDLARFGFGWFEILSGIIRGRWPDALVIEPEPL